MENRPHVEIRVGPLLWGSQPQLASEYLVFATNGLQQPLAEPVVTICPDHRIWAITFTLAAAITDRPALKTVVLTKLGTRLQPGIEQIEVVGCLER